jgi:hypothetical protein
MHVHAHAGGHVLVGHMLVLACNSSGAGTTDPGETVLMSCRRKASVLSEKRNCMRHSLAKSKGVVGKDSALCNTEHAAPRHSFMKSMQLAFILAHVHLLVPMPTAHMPA